jgi:hypothetical protein
MTKINSSIQLRVPQIYIPWPALTVQNIVCHGCGLAIFNIDYRLIHFFFNLTLYIHHTYILELAFVRLLKYCLLSRIITKMTKGSDKQKHNLNYTMNAKCQIKEEVYVTIIHHILHLTSLQIVPFQAPDTKCPSDVC